MPTGCMNPKAVNYDPSATEADGSCIFLNKVNGICYAFQEADNLVDKSYTLSYSLDSKGWVFYHDYLPDFYFSTKTQLYNLKDKSIYKHNAGPRGLFHGTAPSSFFIDAVFRDESEMILNSVSWITEMLSNEQETEFSTLTHLTIWNNQQCTGRIAINDVFSKLEYEVRKTQAIWHFKDFRDMLKTYGTKFLMDLFHNYNIIPNTLDTDKPWFKQDLIHDSFFIIRFEFDNVVDKEMVIHGMDIDVSKSYR